MVTIPITTEMEIHDAFRHVTKQAINNGALGKTVEDAGAGMTNVYMPILGYDQSILQCYPNGEYPYVYILIYKDGMEEAAVPIEDLPEFMQRDIFENYCRELTRKKV